MGQDREKRSDLATAAYVALAALFLFLLALGAVAYFGGGGGSDVAYEGFN